IPVPLADVTGQTVQYMDGRCWEIAPWLPGTPHLEKMPLEENVRTAFSMLARLHCGLARHGRPGPSPGLALRIHELRELETKGFDRLRLALEATTDSRLEAAARQWLALAAIAIPQVLPALDNAARLEVSIQPCLRDARPEHFLFEGCRLTGLVDFGAM